MSPPTTRACARRSTPRSLPERRLREQVKGARTGELRMGPPSCRHGGRRSRRRPCLSSRPRHIPVPLDPHGDRTASFRRVEGVASIVAGAWSDQHCAKNEANGARQTATPRPCPASLHQSKPRPRRSPRTPCPGERAQVAHGCATTRVKTGCRPEGWALSPGHGGPFRSRRFNPPAPRPLLQASLQHRHSFDQSPFQGSARQLTARASSVARPTRGPEQGPKKSPAMPGFSQ